MFFITLKECPLELSLSTSCEGQVSGSGEEAKEMDTLLSTDNVGADLGGE